MPTDHVDVDVTKTKQTLSSTAVASRGVDRHIQWCMYICFMQFIGFFTGVNYCSTSCAPSPLAEQYTTNCLLF